MNDWQKVSSPGQPANDWKPVSSAAPSDDWQPAGAAPKGAYNFQQLRDLWLKHHGPADAAEIMAHVMLAESGGNPNAAGQYEEGGHTYHVRGLSQISDIHSHGSTFDPDENVKAAIDLYRTQGLRPWEDSRNKGAGGGWGQFFDPKKIAAAPSPKPTPPLHMRLADVNLPSALAATKGARRAVNQAYVGAKENADWVRRNPVEALSNVLGTLQRPTAQLASNLLNGKWAHVGENLAELSPITGAGARVQGAASKHGLMYAVMTPQDTQKITDSLETAIFHDLGMVIHSPKVAHVEPAKWHGIAKFVTDLATQTVSDPLTYVPFVDIVSVGSKVVKIAAAASHSSGATKAALTAMGPIAKSEAGRKLLSSLDQHQKALASLVTRGGETIKKALEIRPDLNGLMPQQGKTARLAIESTANYAHSRALADNAHILSRYKPELQSLKYGDKVPDEVQRHLLMEAWRYGTAADRTQAEQLLHAMGMPPTKAELARYPAARGYFNYEGDLQANYVSKILPKGAKAAKALDHDGQAAFEFLQPHGKKIQIPFVKPVTAAPSPALVKYTQYDLISNRLRLGASVLRRQMIAHESANLYRQYGTEVLHGTPGVEDHLLPEWFATNVPDHAAIFKGPWKGLRQVSDAFKMGILGNPLPHGLINVGTVTLFRSNPVVVGRGLFYGLRGVPEHLDERLEAIGGKTSYWRDPSTVPFVVPKAFEASQGVLDRLETGYRASYLQYLDRRMGVLPKSDPHFTLHEYLKGQKVNHDIGDYANPSQLVSALKAIGGLYDTFRLDVVPRAGFHALTHKPVGQTLNLAARTQESFSNQFMPPGEHLQLFGPLDDFAKLSSGAGTLDYMTSTATLGPVLGGAFGAARNEAGGYVSSLEKDLLWLGNYLIPGLGSAARVLPDRSEAPPWIKFWMEALLGGRAKQDPSYRTEKRRHKAFVRAGNDLLGE